MRIERIEIFPLTSQRPALRVGQPIPESWWGYDQTLVRVTTDAGLEGWGTAGTRWELADAARKVLTPHLIGQDATQPEAVTERLHQWTSPAPTRRWSRSCSRCAGRRPAA